MNLRRARREEPEIILIPFIDVLLMLLIFFMLATTFERRAQIAITLPKAALNAPATDNTPIDVTISAEGIYYVDGKRVINNKFDTLKRAIAEAGAGRKDPPIVLNADAKTPHQSVVSVMDAARQLGFVHLSFATSQLPEAQ